MPSGRLPGRLPAAFVDLIVWTVIWFSLAWLIDTLVRAARHMSQPTGPEGRDGLLLVSVGLGALGANLYLAVSPRTGGPSGKPCVG